MHPKCLAAVPAILLLCVLSTGCVGVAAGVAGGTVLAVTRHALDDTAERTLPTDLSQAEAITRSVLDAHDVRVIEVRPSREDGQITGWTFEGGTVGAEVVSIDVVLAKVSDDLTRVRVTATTGWLSPDFETAEAIVERISRQAYRAVARAAAPAARQRPH
jgi:hypothetical protein